MTGRTSGPMPVAEPSSRWSHHHGERQRLKTGTKKTVEVVYIITSADHLAAPPRVLAAWVQHHWRVEVRHEVALVVSEITGMEGQECSTVSSERVLNARPRSWHASLVTAGCEAREEAQGPTIHPEVTGKGKAGRVNNVNLRKPRYPELREMEAPPENRTRPLKRGSGGWSFYAGHESTTVPGYRRHPTPYAFRSSLEPVVSRGCR